METDKMKYIPLVKDNYTEHILDGVLIHKDGIEIQYNGCIKFFITPDRNPHKILPKIGDIALFYGKGFGYEIAGLQINDKLVYYHTQEERDLKHKNWVEKTNQEYMESHKKLMEKIKDEPSFETVSVSGFGSGYERACQLMLRAGIKFLDENEFHFDYKTIKGVYGICFSDTPWSKELDKILLDAVGGDCTGAMHQCVIGHLQQIKEHGYDWWLNNSPEERRFTYPNELPVPSFLTQDETKKEDNINAYPCFL